MNFLCLMFYRILFNPVFVFMLLLFFLPVKKVRQTLFARKGLWKRFQKKIAHFENHKPLIWFHVSSAGEYLQVKYLIFEFYNNNYSVFITMTSISGFSWLERESIPGFEFDFLPMDFTYNVHRLFKILKPSALVVVKTDIWPNLIYGAKQRNIPRFLVCAPDRNFSSFGKRLFYSFIYSNFSGIFPISESSKKKYIDLLGSTKLIETIGDSKFDLVMERQSEKKITLTSLKPDDVCITLGSIWPQDMSVIGDSIQQALKEFPNLKMIIAPHETGKSLQSLLLEYAAYNPVLYSDILKSGDYSKKFKVLLIDTVGDLFFLYANSIITYVGGGFSTGIHNILEPMAMNNVVIFGPRHDKFPEANELMDRDCAFSIKNAEEFRVIFWKFLTNSLNAQKKAGAGRQYIQENTGSTVKLFHQIQRFL
ncbi:MAG: hypothetical protein OEV66_06375 [Spirochaetia bacterium]|nr:hypothetical protein [Spirochaetia bacterium]